MKVRVFSVIISGLLLTNGAWAQELLPRDNGLEFSSYHQNPAYRESESHPLRLAAYVLHPIGWLAREVIFRPVSYLISSTETSRSVFGYREPFDYRHADCFTGGDSVPDCRKMPPYATMDQRAPEPVAQDNLAKVAPATEQQIVFPTVAFDFDKSSLNPLGQERVNQASKVLESAPAVTVVIEGHADSRGSDDYNQKLGMRRAETVKNELVRLGVRADRMSTVSYGESRPLSKEATPEGYALNRRVEFTVKSDLPAAASAEPAAQAAPAEIITGS